MALADTAAYFAILASIGPVALAVTTHLSIDFLRRPDQAEIVTRADLVKLGQRLAVARVDMRGAGEDEPVAIASVTYSIPQT
jgi:acyl-coenzyme A thioesterase PaaI-like protein